MDIFVVNLDRRQDRWSELSDHLRRFGLNHIRVPAVDGRTIRHEARTLVPPSVDASWRSHHKALQMIARSSHNGHALVLEDDAVLSDHVVWPVFLNEIDAYVTREAIDILQLGLLEPIYNYRLEGIVRAVVARGLDLLFRAPSAHWTWHSLNRPPAPLDVIPNSFAPGAHCYVVSSAAAEMLAAVNIPTCLAADQLFTAIALEQTRYGRFRIARAKTSLAAQRSRLHGRTLDSDLEGEYVVRSSE